MILQERMELFFETARERYRIMCRKNQGCRRPWTEDPILQEWRFCNVFREDDKTTVWIRNNVRQPLRKDWRVFLAMSVCRLFNRIDTLEVLCQEGLFQEWDAKKARKLLHGVYPLVGPAYMLTTDGGLDKLDGLLKIIEPIARESHGIVTRIEPGYSTLKDVWDILRMFERIGVFLAYEIVSDLRHTYLLERAPDVNTWASLGPGACRGLGYITADKYQYQKAGELECVLRDARLLLEASRDEQFWPQDWPKWEMREVEHWLCEFGKYVKVLQGGTLKRRYKIDIL